MALSLSALERHLTEQGTKRHNQQNARENCCSFKEEKLSIEQTDEANSIEQKRVLQEHHAAYPEKSLCVVAEWVATDFQLELTLAQSRISATFNLDLADAMDSTIRRRSLRRA
jgi:hypothetical protein